MSRDKGFLREGSVLKKPYEHAAAWISDDAVYRYRLERAWGSSPQRVLWVMLNPSTADAMHDDNTIRAIRRLTNAWGYMRFDVGNIYALRSRDPSALWTAVDPRGPKNFWHVREMAARAQLIVAAWGAHARADDAAAMTQLLTKYDDVWCLGRNANGSPKHPLFTRTDTPRALYAPRRIRPDDPHQIAGEGDAA